MSEHRTIAKRILFPVLFFSLLFTTSSALAQDGKALFKANCAACHNPLKAGTGPALGGVESRWPSKELLYTWIKNWNKAVATGDPYAVKMKDWSPVAMTVFEGAINDKDIDAILAYVETAVKDAQTPTATAGQPVVESDNSLLYGILTLILAVIALILLGVNSNLLNLLMIKMDSFC